MISDEELRELFSAYIDGEVSAEVREQIERRCDEEEGLRAELEDLRELVGSLSRFPEVSAPEGFASRVLAEVEGQDIPSQQARGAASASAHDQALDSLSVPLWLKGSIAASLAATLLLGFFVLRAPLQGDSETMASVGPAAEAVSSWGAPMGTGVDELPGGLADLAGDDVVDELADEDGVVSVDVSQEKTQATMSGVRAERVNESNEAPKASSRADLSVQRKQAAGGHQASAAKRSRRSQKSGLQEVTSDRTKDVYEAEHEVEQALGSANEPAADTIELAEQQAEEGDGVVALAEDELLPPDLPSLEDLEALPRLRIGGFRRESAGSMSATSESKAPVQDTDSGSAASAKFEGGEAELAASAEVVVVSEEQDEEAADVPSIAAKVAIGTLRVASPGVIATMSAEMTSRLWSVQNLTPLPEAPNSLPVVGSQVLQIMVPEGSEEDLSRLLSSYGALNTDRLLAAAHDGNARLRLTVRWGN